jgi:hypothetical protein
MGQKKPLGKLKLYKDLNNYFINDGYIQLYEVKLPYNEDALDTLRKFNCKLKKATSKHMTVFLPPSWYMYKNDSGNISIIDNLYRLRCTIVGNHYEFMTRFNYIVLDKKNGNFFEPECWIIDAGVPVHKLEFPKKHKQDMLIDSRNDKEELISRYTRRCEIFLNETAPFWRLPEHYWDNEGGLEI